MLDFQRPFGEAFFIGMCKTPTGSKRSQAEALGFLHTLHVSWAQGLRYIWFESDNQELVNLINKGEDHLQLGTLLCDIRYWMTKLPFSSLEHVNRERNAAADT
ncbi:unnamed protein product, partial [Arabidopsis halleri]